MNDVLGLLAEIAVAFTGFAALVSALGTAPSGADPRVDRLRLRNLVELGVIAVLMATLPLVLSRSALPGDSVWTVSSTVMLAAMVGIIIIHGGRYRSARVAELAGNNPAGALLMWALGFGIVCVLVSGIFAPSFISRDLAYAMALWLMIAAMGFYFIRIAASLLTHKLNGEETIPD